jgi:signal peptidase I
MPLVIRWFLSRTVRHAGAMRKHVQKLVNHQRDILSPQALEALQTAIRELREALAGGAGPQTLGKHMERMEATANKWLKPYPNPAWRENVEVLLVALAVAMGIRTFFLQPFKIPTGSMQPTLFGVDSTNLKNDPGFQKPSGWAAVKEWFAGVSYIHKVAEADGSLDAVEAPFGLPIFYFWQTLVVGSKSYTIWFPPDYGAPPGGTLEARAGLRVGQFFHKGEDIVNLRVVAGDHLFVDRVSYNFVPPSRGDVVVFETKGIEGIMQDTFYIKRLVGLGGETLSLHHDYDVNLPGYGPVPVGNLVVNGTPITSATPHFERLYSFDGASPKATVLPYHQNHYFGHGMAVPGGQRHLTPGTDFRVQPGHYFVMGDNTMNSLDSRYWGDFPATQVIGKSFFVYWPITDRFGCGYHR